jgi:hypothetical protein
MRQSKNVFSNDMGHSLIEIMIDYTIGVTLWCQRNVEEAKAFPSSNLERIIPSCSDVVSGQSMVCTPGTEYSCYQVQGVPGTDTWYQVVVLNRDANFRRAR